MIRLFSITAFIFLALVASAFARPYLHQAEAECAARGCYGSDNDVAALMSSMHYPTFLGWDEAYTIRYNGYDLCLWAIFRDSRGFTREWGIESYYPHASDTGPGDIWDAFRGESYCPSLNNYATLPG